LAPTRAQSKNRSILAILPGLCLCGVVAGCATALRQASGIAILSPMILAIVMGICVRNVVGVPDRARAGIGFAMKRVLRLAIILLGVQITIDQLLSAGAPSLAIVATVLVSTFLFTTWLGRKIGVDAKLAELIAAGTSICGASAIFATNTVTQAPDDDVVYAVACVTVFGSILVFVYPTAAWLLHLNPRSYGLWAGSSIHEIAQVVAAAFQQGQGAGEFGTIAKLSRVIMLAPLVSLLGFIARRKAASDGLGTMKGAPRPWFVLGFLAMIAINSVVAITPEIKIDIAQLAAFLLAVALAGMGLETDVRKLIAKGMRPLTLAAAATLFISVLSLALIEFVT
jgi:uncharacterized integral membrane protein (TIGR00698 family)